MEFDETLRRSLETNAENAKSYFSKTYEVRDRMSALVGRAVSADGRISVGCSGNGGLTELQIDPRALKMGAAELSRTILELAKAAQADLQRQGEEIMQEAFGEQNPAEMFRDREKFAESLRTMGDAFSGAMSESLTALNELKRRMQA